MRSVLKAAALLVAIGAVAAASGLIYLMNTGLSARDSPGAVETALASRARNLTIGWHAKNIKNPVPATADTLVAGRQHYADHCATCHANDGSGDTDFGRGMFPKPPDMRLGRTQQLTDGELFYIIENGIRFTGMPAFGSGNPSAESSTWPLVHFIRHLPQITGAELEEMERMNPAPPAEIERRLQEERFLQGGGGDGAAPAMPPRPSMPSHKGHQ